MVVPTHFLYDGDAPDRAAPGPAQPGVARAAERPVALFTVVADYVYVPAAVNAAPGSDPALGVPTSYYATVQATASTSRWWTTPRPRPTC